MDLNNPVVKLCIEGTRAEYAGKPEVAFQLYWQAWELAQDDFDACIAAHYVARFQENPVERLRWNQLALTHAEAVGDESVKDFFPSLYLNMGQSYHLLGNEVEAKRFFDLATGFIALP